MSPWGHGSLPSVSNITFFPSMFFCGEATKKKYRWLKEEGFGDGLVVVGKFFF